MCVRRCAHARVFAFVGREGDIRRGALKNYLPEQKEALLKFFHRYKVEFVGNIIGRTHEQNGEILASAKAEADNKGLV